ncbi:hypothetical protein A0J57_21130 [Sphingobium sp. 22B]|uniref:nuclear transport factor 2 family protein n=1 Tax=unclassified Sphingobium TaxID=2611147 RepID=UPI000785264B|nr:MULTISPECIES: nuclear transport factor 2 family protein [unclassified Sphingobium]KXU30246.1 hypothetical protein AXW74_18735 [Sphingobium sp. AM]KYC30336.1 hypothetical protein A0J57_21130 [Sphingobium sp. 22B]OAP29927.1 hypothetical protein A8O16_21105 [Sphingobium sp. 20006FA]
MNHSVEDIIRELENRRIAALVSTDLAALNNLLADDLVHVHGNGKIDDKEEYLQGVASKYRYHSIQRGDLNIRVFGNVAIVVGRLSQTVSFQGDDKRIDMNAVVTQTWTRDADNWRQNSCHTGVVST